MSKDKKVIFSLIIILLFTISCKTQKVSKQIDLQNVEVEINYLEEGYTSANIIYIENVDSVCSFLIRLENNEVLLDPLYLSEAFKVNNTSIWVKYTNQRRPSRCINAQPIEIIDIKSK